MIRKPFKYLSVAKLILVFLVSIYSMPISTAVGADPTPPSATADGQHSSNMQAQLPGAPLGQALDLISKTSQDAWKIAESQWRTANTYGDAIRVFGSVATVAIAALFGFFTFLGYKSLGDLKGDIRAELKIHAESSDVKIRDIREYVQVSQSEFRAILPTLVTSEIRKHLSAAGEYSDQLEKIKKSIEEPASKIDEFLSRYGKDITPIVEAAKGAADPIGDFRSLAIDRANSVTDPEHMKLFRLRARKTLQQLIENESSVNVDDLFNATNMAATLGYSDLGEKLAELAYKRWPIPIHEARLQRFRVPKERTDAAFQRIMELVSNVSIANCELIVADGWNAAEERRDYDSLLEALERRLRNGEYAPSFVHAIAAQAAIRGGKPEWREKANNYLAVARANILDESPMATWYNAAKREIRKADSWLGQNTGSHQEASLQMLQQHLLQALQDSEDDD